jgi:hypothetical protein
MFKKCDFATFAKIKGMSAAGYVKYGLNVEQYIKGSGRKGVAWRYMECFSKRFTEFAEVYFHTVPDSLIEYGYGKKHTA